MKKIYILLTRTGTVLSNIISGYMGDEYTHTSISLDKELNQLYSFGRINPYNPFIGGFVHEGINFGTFKRFKKTRAILFEMPVNDVAYDKIKERINYISSNRYRYKFNILGLFLVAINKKYQNKNTFYCAEFVKYVLEYGIGKQQELPKIIRPQNFMNLKGLTPVYEGLLKNYK